MSFLIYLPILLVLHSASGSLEIYGRIRNASIIGPFNASSTAGYELSDVRDCHECLCNAFRNPTVKCFTCDREKSVCQFYYQMMTRDQVIYSTNETDLYLMSNETLEDDCCNTEHLIRIINNTTREKDFFSDSLRSIVEIDNTTIVGITTDKLWKFNRSDLKPIRSWRISQLKAAGYHNGMYYLGDNSFVIQVYNATLDSIQSSISVGTHINAIRFIGDTQMLVAAYMSGVYVYNKSSDGIFRQPLITNLQISAKQLHAIGIVDQNAFYTGWADKNNELNFYGRDSNNSWIHLTNKSIPFSGNETSDIQIDQCGRVWSALASKDRLLIHHQNGSCFGEIRTSVSNMFNFLILGDNYELVMSHEQKGNSLSRIKPSLNCRRGSA